MIEIYTDGAYDQVRQRGGWAAIVVNGNAKQVLSGSAENTTSNRMEITAALEGILSTPVDSEIMVYTDSQYLFGCMSKNWRRQANLDLWQKLDDVVRQRKVQWEWIEGDDISPFHREAHNRATKLAASQEVDVVEEKLALSHVDAGGRARMVDISDKADTQREAIARGCVRMQPATLELIKTNAVAKGDVLTTAQLAGIMAAKQTASLIPLCHPLLLGDVKVELTLDEKNSAVEITATAKSLGKTGVEMEALTAVAVTGLTIYDMCKAVDRAMQISDIRLVRKSGGKSGTISLETI